VTYASHAPPLEFGPVRLASVLHNPQTVFIGDGHQSIHVDRMAVQVHRDDGLSARCHPALELIQVKVPGIMIHVSEHGASSCVDNGIGGSHIGQRRHNDLVARSDAQREQSQMESVGATRNSDSVTDPTEVSHSALEALNVYPLGGYPSRENAVSSVIQFIAI
jgi:hypothetical protein